MTANDTQDWLRRGAGYRDEFRHGPEYAAQERAIIDALRPLTFDTVLEVGCGFGRITKLVYEAFKPRMYVASDISKEIIDGAAEYVGQAGPGFARFDLDDVRLSGAELPTATADLVIAVEVLMHRPPERVADDVALLCAMARKYVLTCDWNGEGEGGEGNYAHDYAALFAKHGRRYLRLRLTTRQCVTVTFRKTLSDDDALAIMDSLRGALAASESKGATDGQAG